MSRSRPCLRALWFVIATCWFAGPALAQSPKPKVRAITAFIRVEPVRYQQQVADTLKMLRAAKAQYERAGYEVESVRITTQPFPQYIKGMTDDAALAWFRAYDELSLKE